MAIHDDRDVAFDRARRNCPDAIGCASAITTGCFGGDVSGFDSDVDIALD
ncbi:hypothetical protein [Magnetospirillum molischianum]|nr:hypothetical protein [Magnetospirillum molischianum]